jgi:gamma-glutamyltranspeptidase/glutathione hydrolase
MSLHGVFPRAAVAAPSQLAADAGRAVLAEGGNAVEAMLAMAATIAVVYPHMNAIGGDAFWIIREPGGKLRAIEACGPAGRLATIKRYREKGYDAIPTRGPDAAVTVAGEIGGWQAAHELAGALGGKLPMRELLANAIGHARKGFPMSASQAGLIPHDWDLLKVQPGFAETYLQDGKLPAAGTTVSVPRLADMLDHLAAAGLDDFYRGDVGREIAAELEAIGSPVTRADLEAYRIAWREPLTTRIPGAMLVNFPPPTQGLASLVTLGVFSRLGVKQAESFAHIHGLVESFKRAHRIRDRVVTDYDRLRHDPASFLTPDSLGREAAAISASRAAPFPAPPDKGDTIWMGAIGPDGLAVSYIQSTYWEYGSGCVLRNTGVLWQNRGSSFSLDPDSVNPLEPGRRPFHTLNPALAVMDDGRIVSYGSMGGDGQPQFQAQVFSRHVMLGVPLPEAIDAPRFLLGRTWGTHETSLRLENRFDPSLVRDLERAGHAVKVVPQAYSDTFGHAGMLVRNPRTGAVEAGHDPRSDGGAAGI